MPRIPALDTNAAPARSRDTLHSIERAMGAVPNMFRTVAHSPAALQAMWGFFGAMNGAGLSPALREQIALAVGEANGCGYCVAAHSALGAKAGLSREDVVSGRRGQAGDAKAAAALKFARALVENRGRASDAEVMALRTAGFSDAEAIEVVAAVAQNLFTNYINHVAGTEVDFPAVEKV